MEEEKRISIPVKIAVAAIVILLVDAAIMLMFGDREWKGMDTLVTAGQITPLSALFWPLFETGGYAMLFGIDYARQDIRRRRQRQLAQAREEGRKAGREEGREEGYQLGYEAGAADERRRTNGNGHNWMFGGCNDHH